VTEDPLLKDYQAMAAMGPITGDDGAARALAAKELARELAATAKAIRERYEPHITKARAALDGLRGERDEYVSRYVDAVAYNKSVNKLNLASVLAAKAKSVRKRYAPHIIEARATLDNLRGERDQCIGRYVEAIAKLKQIAEAYDFNQQDEQRPRAENNKARSHG